MGATVVIGECAGKPPAVPSMVTRITHAESARLEDAKASLAKELGRVVTMVYARKEPTEKTAMLCDALGGWESKTLYKPKVQSIAGFPISMPAGPQCWSTPSSTTCPSRRAGRTT